MTITWMLLVFLVTMLIARYFRSNKMLYVLLVASLVGLVGGMLGKEAVKLSEKKEVIAFTQEILKSNSIDLLCTQSSLVAVTEPSISLTGVVGYKVNLINTIIKGTKKTFLSRGRDQPQIVDDS